MRLINLTGQKFGRLTVLDRLHNYHDKKQTHWLCVCDCGSLVEVFGFMLRNGNTKSCGCLNKEIITTHDKSNTRLYNIWTLMKARCYNKNNRAYHNYGGRGIAVCDEWKDDFQAFYVWSIENGYVENLSIDRINNNGNYSSNNCRWVTRKQQNRNTRRNRMYTINGVTKCLQYWCDYYKLNRSTVCNRLSKNWSIEKALELE